MAACRSCGASIFWAMTESGKSMPIDQRPDPNGNIVLDENNVAAVMAPAEARGRRRFTSHFATCPNANQHRRR